MKLSQDKICLSADVLFSKGKSNKNLDMKVTPVFAYKSDISVNDLYLFNLGCLVLLSVISLYPLSSCASILVYEIFFLP
jgi:hypothetical protein